MGKKKLPPREMFEIYMDYLSKGGQEALVAQARGLSLDEVQTIIKEVEDVLLGEKSDDPHRAFQIINLYLINIEHILSQVLFTEYARWLKKVRDEGDESYFPEKLVDVAKEVHRIVLNRGNFLVKAFGVKGKKNDDVSDEDLSALLFSEPTDLPKS